MITKDEIEEKAQEFKIHVSNVERDYVFGWFLKLVFENEYLSQLLILKGGNGLRKAFLPDTRFSKDLDFSTQSALDLPRVQTEINNACRQIQERCGVTFDTERNTLAEDRAIDANRKIYKGKVYFKDFYGNADAITISIRLDITEFDKLYLEPVTRELVHPYSDAPACAGIIRCVALEELMANKLKCLIQRRHTHDLYDVIYTLVFAPPEGVQRNLIATTFLKKTIFERSPGAAKAILLGIPLAVFKGAWEKYIVCPVQSRIGFDHVETRFSDLIEQLFAPLGAGQPSLAFVPPEFRNPIMDAGSNQTLLLVEYDGTERTVEPYSLAYKRRNDGQAFEYFYGYDRTGGQSGPGIKAFLPFKIQDVRATEDPFEPRYEIELAKAGEAARKGYFAGSRFGRGRTGSRGIRKSKTRHSSRTRDPYAPEYRVQCPICQKIFTRKTNTTKLNKHKNQWGMQCTGTTGYRVF